MDEAECRMHVATQSVARLATTRADGRIDLVPIVFAWVDGDLVCAVDHKPKRTRKLKRLANIDKTPEVTILFDHYTEDWTTLWWVRLRADAVLVPGGPAAETALDALQERYPQYDDRRPSGPVMWMTPTEWKGWAAAGHEWDAD
jgi:PPOX class probable F420-dependent enzyme